MNCEFSSSTQISFDPVQYQYAKMDCSFQEPFWYFMAIIIFSLVASLILRINKQ